MPLDDPAWLDRMYNNRTLVPDHARYMARWASDSARVRASSLCHVDVPYGDGPGETLDIFPAGTDGAPVLVVIHGGYWRALDKSDHSFIAPAFTNEGACVVVPNYALCPGPADARVTVTHIVRQIVAALAWTWRHIARHGGDPSNIVVAGHSVGGHMATMLLACRWPTLAPDLPPQLVRDALSISGLYDLEPLRRATFLTDVVGLTPSDVALASPVHWPAPHVGRLHCVAGGAESEEFLRQNRLMRDAWGAATVPVCEALPGLNHFSIVDALAQPGSRLHAIAQSLLFGPAPAALT